MDGDRALFELASRQQGLAARRQARELGFSWKALQARVERGEWTWLSAEVLRLVGAPSTERQQVVAAVLHLGPGTFADRATAAALWAVPGFSLLPVHVLRDRRRVEATPLAIAHTTTDLRDTHHTTIEGIPVTTPIRTVFDLAATLHPERLERVLDAAWSRGLVNHTLLQRTLGELGKRGRPGIAHLRRLADERGADHRPPESNTEARLQQLLRNDGQRPLRAQVQVGGESLVGRVDDVDEGLPLIVEVQSSLFHGSVSDRRDDAARIAALRDAGYTVLEIWEHEVWHDPFGTLRRIRQARAELESRARRSAA